MELYIICLPGKTLALSVLSGLKMKSDLDGCQTNNAIAGRQKVPSVIR